VLVVAVAARLIFGGRIGHLKSEIGLLTARVQDYKDKLSGKTPEEAKAQIDALSARIAALEPRHLTLEQVQTITQHVTIPGTARPMLRMGYEISVSDAKLYGEGFVAAFQDAGWHVDGAVMTGPSAPSCGLAVWVKDAQNPTDYERLVIAGLRAASVEFEIQTGVVGIGHASIFIGTRRIR
jgi:hypothetical protein